MKTNNLPGLLALPILLFFSASLFAQTSKAPEAEAAPMVFEYSAISLSDPSIYADEPFTISLTVKNTSSMDSKHEVRLLLEDKSEAKGKRKQAGKAFALAAGKSETVSFTFQAKDLLKEGEEMPDSFTFYLGKFEIGVPVEGK